MIVKNKTSYIYVYTNLITGKKYVGETTNMQHRTSEHNNCEGANICKLGTGILLDEAIWAYGADNFKCDIVDTCQYIDRKKRERFWQEKLDTIYPGGYNTVPDLGYPSIDIEAWKEELEAARSKYRKPLPYELPPDPFDLICNTDWDIVGQYID